jgi:branched-chain amino acid transport system substrate-binding protein
MRTRHRLICILLVYGLLFICVWANATDLSPVRIGATVSLEGAYREPSLMIKKSFQLWQQEVNQRGGLLGRKVELLLLNDKSRKDLAGQLYAQLVNEVKVDLLFSPYGTPLTLAASEVSEEHKYLMLACGASSESIWNRGHRYVLGVYALANRYFIGLLDLMSRNGHRRVSLIYDDGSPFNQDVAAGVRKWAKRFRIKIPYDRAYQDGEKNLPLIVSELKSAKIDRVIMAAYSPDCYRLLDEMQKQKYKPQVMGMTIAPIHPDFWQKAGEMAKNVFAPSQWEPSERIPFPGTKKFVKSFKKFTGELPSYHAGSAYAACQLIEEAVNNTNSLDNSKLRDYIAALNTVTVIGRFKVDPSGRQIGHNPITIQWQQGKKEIVWPTKMQTAKPQI